MLGTQNKANNMKRLLCLILAISVTGCASTTVINSTPNGAQVYLNGEKTGTTPYAYTDKKIVGSTNTVLLKKEGYQDFLSSFSRDDNVNVGALIGGLFLFVPFLWVMNYKPTYSYELEPQKK